MQLFHILLLFLSVKSMIVKNWSAVHFYHIVIRTIHVSNVFRNYINAAKFQVQTFCNDTGYFEIKLRMRKDEFDSADMLELKHWLEVLEPLTALLKEYVAEAKPQRATYAI